jgi:hypothetical protein
LTNILPKPLLPIGESELTQILVPLPKRGFLIIFYLKEILNMAKGQRLKPEQIVTLLRQIDVLTTNGKTPAQTCKEVGTVEQSYYRWRKIYGGMKVDQAKKYKIWNWKIPVLRNS